MNFNKIINTIRNVAAKGAFKIKKYSPEILLGTGIAGVVCGTVLACKETIKATEIIEDHNECREIIETVSSNENGNYDDYSPEDKRADIAKLYFQTGLKLAKNYLPSITVIGSGIACILGGFGILKNRNAQLVAANAALTSMYEAYRKKTAEAIGEEKENDIFAGLKEEVVEKEVVDENGKKKKKKEKIKVFDETAPETWPDNVALFAEETSQHWTRSHSTNMSLILDTQRWAQEMVKSRGYIWENEIRDALGLPVLKKRHSYGYVYRKGVEEPVISFGMLEGQTRSQRDFMNGYENATLIIFNGVRDILNDFEDFQNV